LVLRREGVRVDDPEPRSGLPGQWEFARNNGGPFAPIFTGERGAIRAGLHIGNTVEVRSNQSHFDLYVNEAKVGQVDEPTYVSGVSGIEADGVVGAEYVFTNFSIST
jgi:hypothetical protein